MHLWFDIVSRELIMLVTLLMLGAGPAAFLGRRVDAAARIAIAPALGLCVGACLFTTLLWFLAARDTYWLLPIFAIGSVAIALTRARALAPGDDRTWGESLRVHWLPRGRDMLALTAVCVVVAGPFSYTLHERGSVGPTGYLVYDVIGYVGETDGMVQQSIQQADRTQPEHANLLQRYWNSYSRGGNNLDASPLSANLNELMGWGSTDSQTLFLITFLVVDALAAFAAVRYFATKPFWAAPWPACSSPARFTYS